MPMPVSWTLNCKIEGMSDAVDGTSDFDEDMPGFGELDGVAGQIGDDLPQASDIPYYPCRERRIDADDQFDVLVDSAA
jgi:hypothetical protein